ncbi:MAG: hypothetical protein ACREIC_09660, partial [Limisphaerales bacterium]
LKAAMLVRIQPRQPILTGRASTRSVVKQDHIWPTPRNRRGSTFPSDQPSPAGYGAAGHFCR